MRRKDPRPAMSGMSYDDYRHETHLASVIAARRPFGAGGEARAPPSRVTPSPARARPVSHPPRRSPMFSFLSLSSQPVEMFCSRVKLSTATNGLVILLRAFPSVSPPPNAAFPSVSPPPNAAFPSVSPPPNAFPSVSPPPNAAFPNVSPPPNASPNASPLRPPPSPPSRSLLLPSFLRLLPRP